MGEYEVVELDASDTYPLRLRVLRARTPSNVVTFDGDDHPRTVHLGVRRGGTVVAVSTWIPKPYNGAAAVQLRGMATATHLQGQGLGAMLLEAGCERAGDVAPLVWARARDTALAFYLRHGFTVDGDGFVDSATQLPHHIVVRRLASDQLRVARISVSNEHSSPRRTAAVQGPPPSHPLERDRQQPRSQPPHLGRWRHLGRPDPRVVLRVVARHPATSARAARTPGKDRELFRTPRH